MHNKTNIIKKRNYGIDLLRMFSMFLVALLHVLGQGGIINATGDNAAANNSVWLLETAAYCAVNCYALISGYVGLNSKFRYTGIIMLWLRVVFYTVSITTVFSFIKPEVITAEHWWNAFFPVSTKQYWYFTAYVLCYLFTPLLNKIIHSCEKNLLRKSLIGIVCILSIPTLFTGSDVFGSNRGYSAIWLIILYLVGGYMKKYDSFKSFGKIEAFTGYFSVVMISWTVKILLNRFVPDFDRATLFISYTSPTIIAAAIFLLILFKQINPTAALSKVIGFFSAFAFSVYIIHVHPVIWQNVIKELYAPLTEFSAPALFFLSIAAALGLYIVCSLIDIIRHYLFKLLHLQQLVSITENKITDLLTHPKKNVPEYETFTTEENITEDSPAEETTKETASVSTE